MNTVGQFFADRPGNEIWTNDVDGSEFWPLDVLNADSITLDLRIVATNGEERFIDEDGHSWERIA